MNDQSKQPAVYDWQTAIAFAVVATAAAVGLIVLFTYLVDWVGDFWSQVIYFLVMFGGIVARITIGTPGGIVFAVLGAVLLLYLYRRFVQGRGITGPSARRLPPKV